MMKIVKTIFFINILMAGIDYESQIQPIFDSRCIDCHGNFGGLDMSSYENLMNGGNNMNISLELPPELMDVSHQLQPPKSPAPPSMTPIEPVIVPGLATILSAAPPT